MIDTKSKMVLKILAKECGNDSFKIFEVSDIIMSMPKYLRADAITVKHILTYLDRLGMITIKYDDDDVFCLAVLPYGFETLEMEKSVKQRTKPNFLTLILSFVSAFLGTVIGIVVCYFLFKFI